MTKKSNQLNFFKQTDSDIDFAILSAMPEELGYFYELYKSCDSRDVMIDKFKVKIVNYNEKNILLTHTGLGTAFAASIVTLINQYFKPEFIFFCGTAGAISNQLKIRDVVIGEKAFEAEIQDVFDLLKNTPFESCLTHPLNQLDFPSVYSGDSELIEILKSESFKNLNTVHGTIVTSNQFPAPKELFEKIKKYNPHAIDMETSAVYQVAWLLKIRIISIRGISNVLNHDGSDENVHESDVKGSAEAAGKVISLLINLLSLKIQKPSLIKYYDTVNKVDEVKKIIDLYSLKPHPEGGYYARTFESDSAVKSLNTDIFQNESRKSGTAIYYLLDKTDFSAWHRLKSDEIWHFYKGSPLLLHEIDNQGLLHSHILGDPFSLENACYQLVIKAGNWFAAEVIDKSNYCLVGCTVSPGFDFKDFELANYSFLAEKFPKYQDIFSRLTRQDCEENYEHKISLR